MYCINGLPAQCACADPRWWPTTAWFHSPKHDQPTPPPLTRQQLARRLGISYHTLRRRLAAIDVEVPPRRLLDPLTQERILRALGYYGEKAHAIGEGDKS